MWSWGLRKKAARSVAGPGLNVLKPGCGNGQQPIPCFSNRYPYVQPQPKWAELTIFGYRRGQTMLTHRRPAPVCPQKEPFQFGKPFTAARIPSPTGNLSPLNLRGVTKLFLTADTGQFLRLTMQKLAGWLKGNVAKNCHNSVQHAKTMRHNSVALCFYCFILESKLEVAAFRTCSQLSLQFLG